MVLELVNKAVTRSRYVTAKQAAQALGISQATLYSYVSRGLIRSEASAEDNRVRRYFAEDVENLKVRHEQRRNPAKATREALHWGTPILDSALTLITDGNLYYRGRSAFTLAREFSFEEVAALLWLDDEETAQHLFKAEPSSQVEQVALTLVRQSGSLPYPHRLIVALAAAEPNDLRAHDLSHNVAARTGARILRLAAKTITGSSPSETHVATIAEQLSNAWLDNEITPATRLINAALITCADHELNASAFAVRVTASAGATLYQAMISGLATLQGVKHGGMTDRVEILLRDLITRTASGSPEMWPTQVKTWVIEQLQRGERLPGYGHRLYPDGDPRAAFLLAILGTYYPHSPVLALTNALIQAVETAIDEQPTVDLALAAVAVTLGLPPGAGLALFALGRMAGWIAHALEQYRDGNLIRPRAHYVGPPIRKRNQGDEEQGGI